MKPAFMALLAAGFFVSSGCGGEMNAQVSGKLLQDGKPVLPKENEELHLSFVAINPDAKIQLGTAEFEPDTSVFTLHGPAAAGIPPGEYKIVVTCAPYPEGEPDRFDGAFAEDKTPLRYTVTRENKQEIVIDLKSKSVTRQ